MRIMGPGERYLDTLFVIMCGRRFKHKGLHGARHSGCPVFSVPTVLDGLRSRTVKRIPNIYSQNPNSATLLPNTQFIFPKQIFVHLYQ